MAIVLWPFKETLRTVLFVSQINHMVNVVSNVAHRALLVHEAIELEVLPSGRRCMRRSSRRR